MEYPIIVSIANLDSYDSFKINDIEKLLNNIRSDPFIADKYKSMDEKSLKNWIEKGVTKYQYDKLNKLNSMK